MNELYEKNKNITIDIVKNIKKQICQNKLPFYNFEISKENYEKYKEQWGRYPEKNNMRASKRRAAVRNQTPDLTEEQVKEILTIYEECSRISNETGIPHEVDHIIPICKGGLHHPNNLQILTMKENRSKGDK